MSDIKFKKKATTMEITKISASLLVAVIITFGTFAFSTGVYRNELKNLKTNLAIIKIDSQEDTNRVASILQANINRVELNSAKKEIVNLIFKKIESMDEKLDRIIESKSKEK